MLEFRVLGPLEVIDNGRPIVLTSARERTLLALLLIHANEFVSADRLIDWLWGERPPKTARTGLHNAVSMLRKRIDPALLQTRPPGYALVVALEQVDYKMFEHLLRKARTDDPNERVGTLEHALSMWRGEPLMDVAYESFAQPEIQRLQELRITAQEDLCETRIGLGESEDVVPALRALVAEQPLRERLRRLLMLALHRTGRSPEALASYVEWDAKIREEWGLEPGEAIRAAWREIVPFSLGGTERALGRPELREGPRRLLTLVLQRSREAIEAAGKKMPRRADRRGRSKDFVGDEELRAGLDDVSESGYSFEDLVEIRFRVWDWADAEGVSLTDCIRQDLKRELAVGMTSDSRVRE